MIKEVEQDEKGKFPVIFILTCLGCIPLTGIVKIQATERAMLFKLI